MKTLKDDDAFSSAVLNANGEVESSRGMSKREEFAKAAMIGILSSAPFRVEDIPVIVAGAQQTADDLIEQLNDTQ